MRVLRCLVDKKITNSVPVRPREYWESSGLLIPDRAPSLLLLQWCTFVGIEAITAAVTRRHMPAIAGISFG